MIQEADLMVMSDKGHHYLKLEDVPLHIQKYWKNRHKIFSFYNDGVYMTDDAWFGVTPEPIARRIAMDLPHPDAVTTGLFAIADEDADADEKTAAWDRLRPTVIDLFAGAGGNTIQFALSGRWQRVIGIERDRATLACAQNNAHVAGVPEGVIVWIHGDCFDILQRLRAGEHVALFEDDGTGNYVIRDDAERSPEYTYRLDSRETVVFASPPWGGVSYNEKAVFDLSTMEPYSLQALHDLCSPLAHALYLPRTSDLQQLADAHASRRWPGQAAGEGKKGNKQEPKLDVVQYCMHGFSKALVAYYPSGAGEADDADDTDAGTA